MKLEESGATPQPTPFQVMVKPAGAACNLGCRYCYYLSKDVLYPGSDLRMSDDLLEEFTRQYLSAQSIPEVTFAWQGGEPTLMGIDFYQRAVELQSMYARPGVRVLNSIQTNGTLLDDAWCRFLHDHDFLVGISIDGPEEQHNAFRVDKVGRPSFERVIRGLDRLKAHKVEWNLLATVHAANAAYPLEVYRFFRDELEARFIQFIPIVERVVTPDPGASQTISDRSVTGRQYGEFLIAIFDEWVRRDVGEVFVQIFDVALGAWLDQAPGLCVFGPTCGDALALEHNGDLYSCDHFVDPEHRLGNIRKSSLAELTGSEIQKQFGQAKLDSLPGICHNCPVRFVCNGGCPKNRFPVTPEGEDGLNWLCEGYKSFFTHIDKPMQFMAAEYQANRPAANIMRHLMQREKTLKDRFRRAGRNDPCPCGSGRKFKRCHGRSRSST